MSHEQWHNSWAKLRDSILEGLNENQRKAVTASTSEPLQIRAGPGTGKTKVLVARVAYLLLHHGLRPQHIIVTTFTKKAAKEMIERLHSLLEGTEIPLDKLFIGTFHSISYRIIQKYGSLENLVGFTVAGEKDSAQLLEETLSNDISEDSWSAILSLSDADLAPFTTKPGEVDETDSKKPRLDKKKILRQISKLKARALFPEDYAKQKDSNFLLSLIYSRYQQRLFDHKLLDFDDCLLYCYKIISKRPVLRFVEHTLVDEFQDTNEVQLQLMFRFAKVSKEEGKTACGVTIVGDLDQSIYAFRDAQVGNFKTMLDHYSLSHSLRCHIIDLTHNYRSTTDILAFSEKVMRQQSHRTQKELVARSKHSLKPVKAVLTSLEEEARWVSYNIEQLMSLPDQPILHSDIAVLVRSAYQTRVLESEFVRRKIPYKMVKGRAFWERKEVTAVVDYLRCVANENDRLAFLRCLNFPKRGFGQVANAELERIFEENASCHLALSNDIHFQLRSANLERLLDHLPYLCLDVLKAIARKEIKSSFGPKLIQSLNGFISIIEGIKDKINKDFTNEPSLQRSETLAKAFDSLLTNSGLEKEFGDDENRRLNVAEVRSQFKIYEEPPADDVLPEYDDEMINSGEGEEVIDIIDDSEVDDDVVEILPLEASILRKNAVDLAPGQAFVRLFLALVVLYETDESQDKKEQPRVSISTIHGAKGLEWPVVFIPGVSEGLIPASFALDGSEDAINEERRCFYVASTRAKTLLYISAYIEAEGSGNWGRKAIEKPSRFLNGTETLLLSELFDSEENVRKLYTMLEKALKKDFNFSTFNEKALKKYNLHVKQTTDMNEERPGFVTGLDVKDFNWQSKNSRYLSKQKRPRPQDTNAPMHTPKQPMFAPFKPVVLRSVGIALQKDILKDDTAVIGPSSGLRAPPYIPQRAKHKRRLGTR